MGKNYCQDVVKINGNHGEINHMPTQAIIYCNVILSKKLQALVEQGSVATILVGIIEGNKAKAQVTLDLADGVEVSKVAEMGETSLIMNNFHAVDTVAQLGKETLSEGSVSGLFVEPPAKQAPTPKQSQQAPPKPKTVINKVIVENPDQVPFQHPLAQQLKKQVVSSVSPTENPTVSSPSNTVNMTHAKLIELLNAIPNVDSFEDPREQNTDRFVSREEALEMEKQLSTAPKLPFSVFIQNKTGGPFEIADIETIFKAYQVVDLSHLPAIKIKNSRDLAWGLKTNRLAFVDESTYVDWLNGKLTDNDEQSRTWWEGAKTFVGSGGQAVEAAFDAMRGNFAGFDGKATYRPNLQGFSETRRFSHEDREHLSPEMDITMEGADGQKEFVLPESEFSGLIQTIPEKHSLVSGTQQKRPQSRPAKAPDPNKPTIRRTGIQY